MNTTTVLGNRYEDKACAMIEAAGGRILARNFRCRAGEIDIVAKLNQTLLFVEVKYRKNDHFGQAAEMVTPAKQRKLYTTAAFYQRQHPTSTPCRFDVIHFTGNAPGQWLENAFSAA